jgi:hypothetical protein
MSFSNDDASANRWAYPGEGGNRHLMLRKWCAANALLTPSGTSGSCPKPIHWNAWLYPYTSARSDADCEWYGLFGSDSEMDSPAAATMSRRSDVAMP